MYDLILMRACKTQSGVASYSLGGAEQSVWPWATESESEREVTCFICMPSPVLLTNSTKRLPSNYNILSVEGGEWG